MGEASLLRQIEVERAELQQSDRRLLLRPTPDQPL
jgi:hypothetical protein